MSTSFHPPPRSKGAQRVWLATLAAAVGSALLSGVLGLFSAASQMPWLVPTAHNVRAMAVCEGVHGSAAQRGCVERVVAAVTRASEARATLQARAVGGA